MVAVRTPRDKDFESIARISGQLGYPCSGDVFKARYDQIMKEPCEALFVAEVSDRVVGWVHVQVRPSLIREKTVEVAALIVDERERGKQVGKLLMEKSESWARSQWVDRIWLRSNVKREGAHRFYERLGYELTKTSHKFEKRI